ncbi:MAG: hypothetical protein Edafosvirus4_10 [Edafosvirus sp.]|uniref:VWFA domain-containing protein n=1 Tax=Edafosvirus sp. TaxID=2487765 RepID=A0A3G4ZT03_9VIRU|nr:MAG: hypothetical protein Edafosvirus4_10 [Edafosvirus sp.]
MTSKDFSVDILQTVNGEMNSNSCVIGWNKSLLETDFVKQVYKLYLLIDNSGSMSEVIQDSSCEPPKMVCKMNVVKETLVDSLLAIRGLSQKTGITIHVCLLSFNDEVTEIVPLTVVNDSTFPTFVAKINSIGCRGSTLLGEALESTMTLMTTGVLPTHKPTFNRSLSAPLQNNVTQQLYNSSVTITNKSSGLFSYVKSIFSKAPEKDVVEGQPDGPVETKTTPPSTKVPDGAPATKVPDGAPATKVPDGISKIVLLTDGHANGPMKPDEIIKRFGNKISVCIGLGNTSNYDAPLLTALSPEGTFGGYNGEAIRQNFVGALFSMYTIVAKDITITLPKEIEFTTPSELKSVEGSTNQTIHLTDFHPTRKVVLAFKSNKETKVELPVSIKYFDMASQKEMLFTTTTVALSDTKEYNTHIIEYCALTSKFTAIVQQMNTKYGKADLDNKNVREQQTEIEKLCAHIKAFKPCPLDNPIYDMWTALMYEMERLNELKHGHVDDYVGRMTNSRQQQSSGSYVTSHKTKSDFMSKK